MLRGSRGSLLQYTAWKFTAVKDFMAIPQNEDGTTGKEGCACMQTAAHEFQDAMQRAGFSKSTDLYTLPRGFSRMIRLVVSAAALNVLMLAYNPLPWSATFVNASLIGFYNTSAAQGGSWNACCPTRAFRGSAP
jgi:hypothetical protein